MKRRHFYASRTIFALIASVLLLNSYTDIAWSEPIAQPTELLRRAYLAKDITLKNSVDIYERLDELKRDKEAIQTEISDLTLLEFNVAWLSNPSVDARQFDIKLCKGLSLYQVIEAVASQRGEVVVDRQGYTLIHSPNHRSLLSTYREPVSDKTGPLADWTEAIIPPGRTIFEQLSGDSVEEFINTKLKESLSLSENPQSIHEHFFFKIDSKAKPEISKVSVEGRWEYATLLDAYSALLDLRWRNQGDALWLEKAPRQN